MSCCFVIHFKHFFHFFSIGSCTWQIYLIFSKLSCVRLAGISCSVDFVISFDQLGLWTYYTTFSCKIYKNYHYFPNKPHVIPNNGNCSLLLILLYWSMRCLWLLCSVSSLSVIPNILLFIVHNVGYSFLAYFQF